MNVQKVEWEGREITIPDPFSKPDHLVRYVVSLLGWQLQNGVNYETQEEFIKEIKKDFDLPDTELKHILDILEIQFPVLPNQPDYIISNTANLDFVLDDIKTRRSIRVFNDESVDDSEILNILDAARHAPSARNIQPIEYIIVKDKDIKEKLSKAARQSQPTQAPVSIVVIGDKSRAGIAGKLSIHDTTTNNKGTDVFIYMDAAAAVQNMLLTAHNMGIGSLWISSFDAEVVSQALNLPEDHVPLAIIPLGRYEKNTFKPPRRSLDELVHFDGYEEKNHDPRHYNFSHLIHVRY
jgi:nitroreductase